ncbi:hypothetical protein D3C72_1085770 [compost metagenome]
MLSSTTMAASSTMPTAKAIPAREMMFSVLPITLSRQKVSMMLMGMAIAIIRVALSWRRKTQRMAQESSTPSPRLAVTMPTARLM